MAQAVYRLNDFILNYTGYDGYTNPIPALLGYTGTGTKPIFPAQELPESNVLPGAFIIYNYRTSTNSTQWWLNTDEVNYMIHATDIETSSSVIEAMDDLFRRQDESAIDLMRYLKGVNKIDYDFKYVRVVNKISPDVSASEGGRHSRIITVRYDYTKVAGLGLKNV